MNQINCLSSNDKYKICRISTYNVESAAATPPPPTTTSRFYLIPESDLFVCEIWICSLFLKNSRKKTPKGGQFF